ncbi:4'-phosphopantetheinyl transferase family protein [Pandoraea sp. NPDC087047]|uniref:4'-phosphopantetheinyl transferase family protein n=1 Tax=Pandoraea sp. NPDC087047 TaxID=3364390 RepID=UPI00382BC34F
MYRIDLSLDHEPAHALASLDPAERERATRFVQCADRVRFAVTRAAVRRLLASRIGCTPERVRFALDRHGKPHVAGVTNMPFNVTHSGEHALIAIGDGARIDALGVDIEACRPEGHVMAILDTAFAVSEQNRIRAAADPLGALYRHWTAKEAVLKAVGVGVAEHLLTVTVDPESAGSARHTHLREIIVRSQLAEWTSLQAMTLAMPDGYVAALAWRIKEHSCKTS